MPYGADPVPTLLTFNHAVFAKNQMRIGKYTRCDFKIDAGIVVLYVMHNRMRFVWDALKNRSNRKKHGSIDFEIASRVFAGVSCW